MSVFDNNRVDQSNVVANKVTGRDDNSDNSVTNITNIFGPTVYNEDKTLKKLLAEHETEKLHNQEYRSFSEELNKFFIKSLKNKLRDLEQKLIDGNREYLVEAALDSKEKLTRKISRLSHYKSAQDIYTYLLTNIRTAFLHEVGSKIKSGSFREHEINDIVSHKIIDPILHNLQGSSLNIDKDELYGALYFLTGNCYIEWD